MKLLRRDYGFISPGNQEVGINFSFFCSLKRTTDVMFGGKQVLVCGYGEVNDKLSFA